ncbi:MAG TPA: glycosyltransferase family 1 protein [Patescibacteria group bacterium]
MKIGINASFLRKQGTGIGQVTANFIKKLAEIQNPKSKILNEDMEFFLYLEEDADLELPENTASSAVKFHKVVFLPKYKRDDLIRKIWWEKFLLPTKAKKDECDVMLSLYQNPTIVSNAKHIMVVHDIIPELFPEYLNNSRKKLYWKLTKKAIRKADKIIAISHRTEKDLVQHLVIDPKKITVVYEDVDAIYKKEISQQAEDDVLKKYGLEKGYIYHGGGLEKRKNTENLLRAYKMLLENNAKTHALEKIPKLVISGKLMPELSPLVTDAEALVKELDLEEKVVLLDYVPQEDLPGLYANAATFVYPSRYEGFGLPVLEAMNVGVPVITAKTSSLPEVGGDAALYCDPNDPHDMMLVLRNALSNERLRKTMVERGKLRAEKFSWDRFVEKILHIIETR